MSMSAKSKAVLVVGALMLSGSARGHGGEDHGAGDMHVMGTVDSTAGSEFTVKGSEGKPVNVHVDDSTKYEKGDEPGAAGDIKVGIRVAVQGEMMKDGTLHATKVRYVKIKSAPAKPAKAPTGGTEHAEHPKK